jgi:NAD(P)-dependent dehydrogenase (short-subunit alcohol dehydrogenase family)
MIERGEGGAIVLTSSSAGLKAYANCAAYVSSKHGLTGLTRAALELAPHKIRVNAICPSNVSTPMFQNDVIKTLFAPGQDLSDDEWAAAVTPMNLLEVPWVESDDITNAAMYLCGDEGRYLTGVTLPVDAGLLVK